MVRRRFVEPDPLEVEVARAAEGDRLDVGTLGGVPHAGLWSRRSFEDGDELVCAKHDLPVSQH